MKKVIGLIIVMAMIVVPGVVLAGDSREVLTLKRDFVNEKVLRLTAEYKLLVISINQGIVMKAEMEKAVPEFQAQLKQYNEQLIAMEAAETAPTEPVKTDKNVD